MDSNNDFSSEWLFYANSDSKVRLASTISNTPEGFNPSLNRLVGY